MEKYKGKERFDLIVSYAEDTVDEAVVRMPAEFFVELLKRESHDVCKWYEIRAIGERGDASHAEVLFDVLRAADVRFPGGSSLHSIAAGALGRIGAAVVPRALELWREAEEQTRIALIDTLGETGCDAAVEALAQICPFWSDREFVYGARAFSKCGTRGNEVLQELYGGLNDPRKLCVIDALGYDDANDGFLRSVLQDEGMLLAKALGGMTKGMRQLIGRIEARNGVWCDEDAERLAALGAPVEP